ncbi:potassium channel family protein [Geomonas sp.]|uniref:potassium channel family protein n=1 Tax=Geomonas sp. TaxID=2651584 RepID=UPI002B48AE71|nr:potassium channel family protein [Geomonas sp.]HJV34257.1 potassium channel family protein [Geomonas sp.]
MKLSRADIVRGWTDLWLGDRGLSAFLVLVFLALFLGPIVDWPTVRLLTSLLLSLLMVAGVVSMSRRPTVRWFAGMIALCAIVLRWLTHIVATSAIARWSSLISLIFMVLLTVGTLYKVYADDRPVTAHRIMGAVAAYLLFGITWSILYGLLDQVLPGGAFSITGTTGGFDAERQEKLLFFSFVTLTTVGYGDITPTHDLTRMFAVVEALVGQLYPATLLARLVSLEVSRRGSQPEKD